MSERSNSRYRAWAPAIACLMALCITTQGGVIQPGLEQILARSRANEIVPTLVFLKDQVDVQTLDASLRTTRASLKLRHETVVRTLQHKAQTTQQALGEHLAVLQAQQRIAAVRSLWLANAFRVDACADELRQLAQHPDVEAIYYNYPIEAITPVKMMESPSGRDDPEPGLVAINVPQVWDLGITGAGVTVATIDSGVDANHPALAARWAGVADPQYDGHPEWAWHDALNGTLFPQDLYGHGTHTMGTVCGGAPGDQVGVAPGANWISACNLASSTGRFVDNSIVCLQWIADPDNDPSTIWDVPAVCSNSWGLSNTDVVPPCDDRFWSFIDACEAAGVVILFSAGNDGYLDIGRPASRATDVYNTCAIGAVDTNVAGWPIADFSSRGPTECTPTGELAIKPELAAPGVQVRSSVPGGEYMLADGTSMASPHVNGVVALMLEACPYLTVNEIKQILYDTAVDLGPAGEDNDFGWGMIDALAAVNRALDVCSPRPPYAWNDAVETNVNTVVSIRLRSIDDELPDPPGQVSYVIVTLPAHGALHELDGAMIETVPHLLSSAGNEVVYEPAPHYRGPDEFRFVANDGGEPPAGGDSAEAVIELTVGLPSLICFEPLDTDPGWTRECEWEFGPPTGQGGQDYGWPDPTGGYTGTNVFGVNLDGDYAAWPSGVCCLTTPPMDFSDAYGVTVRFWRWLNIDQMVKARATIEVSTDGQTWHELWCNGLWQYTDNIWRPWEYDLSAIADGEPAVRVRWCYQINPMVTRMSGWNIDDIEFRGYLPIEWTPGDLDGDSDVDLDDCAVLTGCMRGPDVSHELGCASADLQADTDVDLADVAAFANLYGIGLSKD